MSIKHDFRILIETHKKKYFSYMSSSICNSDIDINYAISASSMWNRITGSISCSYENTFTVDTTSENFYDTGNGTFKDNIYLSSSLSGDINTGSIQFIYTGVQSQYNDRLNRFKIFGSGFCSSTGVKENFWYQPEGLIKRSGSRDYFKGDVDAHSLSVFNNF